ncbi:Undecaprenyl-phosphategalactosephosphotransferase [Lactiplantibacillus plantarum]|uniref:sugar transferase n=1 Tax=Lactiplantibacillus plantarum TaxID=1590 RepID=UPI0007B54492|nr:sugar transferase [Lactiplantibacillus plantarum]KZU29551.1 Undecaprenyl-phosphategalactosephosphotransferase [Lactiplantibacillus plantarum]KZU74260.1 Undecaprenyl-phosphategalactosephosphotransferase [Lactiplantibacillus plantarum]
MGNQVSHTETVNEYDFVTKLDQPFLSFYTPFKRLFDLIFSLILMIPASIIILVFMVLVKIETPGKCFYTQERVGLMGQTIKVTKLRSMYNDAEKKSGAMWAQKEDPRVTRVGHFMRKTRVDELPQLWSVVKGDMSLIGPRPERPVFTQQFSEDIEGFEQRLLVKPGLSGYAQVHGGYDDTPAQKLENDMYYIEHFSITTDLAIFFETLRVVVTGDGAR